MDFLIEHNVINRDAISNFVEHYADQCSHSTAQEWFRVVAARYLEKEDSYNRPLGADERPIGNARPHWLDAAIARGDDLRVFTVPDELEPLFEHIVDYFNWLDQNDQGRKLLDDKQRFMRLTVPSAIQKSREWVARQAREAGQVEVSGADVVFEDGGYYWIDAKTPQVLAHDGKLIQNCLGRGTYHEEVQDGSMKVYIMRDRVKNMPHVAIRLTRHGNGWSVSEVKGKQNDPPGGRYVELTKRFLNWLNVPVGSARSDIERMGLRISSDGKVGSLRDSGMGKLVWHKDNVDVVQDGTQYWFMRENDVIARVNINALVTVSNLADESKEELQKNVRPYVRDFLNQFPNVPPPGKDPGVRYEYESALRSKLNLNFNFENHQYGNTLEAGVLVMEEGGLKVIRWQREQSVRGIENQYYVFSGNKQLMSFHLAGSDGKQVDWLASFDDETGDANITNDHLELLCGILNTLGARDPKGKVQTEVPEICYSVDGFGLITDMGKKLWSHAGWAAYLWSKPDDDSQVISFLENGRVRFEIDNSSTHFGYKLKNEASILENDRTTAEIADILTKALNSKGFAFMRDENHDFENIGVFYQGKWGSREQVSEKYHEFESAAFFSTLKKSSGNTEYILSMPDKKPVFSLSIGDSGYPRAAYNLGNIRRLGLLGPYFKWLFNHLKVKEISIPSHGHRYGDREQVATDIFAMGLFYDARSSEWRLTQEGKTAYQGQNWRAVTFRNRLMIWDDKEGIIGWVKKDGDLLREVQPIHPFQLKDMLDHLAELCRNTDYSFAHPSDVDDLVLRQAGYHRPYGNGNHYQQHRTKTINRINDTFGSDENFLPLKGGWLWKHLPYDPEFANDEHHMRRIRNRDGDHEDMAPRFHGERYTLVDSKGNWWARIGFTEDGYLEEVTWRHVIEEDGQKVIEVENGTKNMNRKLVPLVTALIDKKDFRLTPQQAADLKVFRKNGKYVSMGTDRMLLAFANGFIDFGDGHAFMRDRYDPGIWELGSWDPNTVEVNNRFRPYVEVKLSSEGLEHIQFKNPEVKRRPKLYTSYIHKLIDIFDKTVN